MGSRDKLRKMKRHLRRGADKVTKNANELKDSVKKKAKKIFQDVHEVIDDVKSAVSSSFDELTLENEEGMHPGEGRDFEEVRDTSDDSFTKDPPPHKRQEAKKTTSGETAMKKQKPLKNSCQNESPEKEANGEGEPSLIFSQQPEEYKHTHQSPPLPSSSKLFFEYPSQFEIDAAIAKAKAVAREEKKNSNRPLLGRHASKKEALLSKYQQQQHHSIGLIGRDSDELDLSPSTSPNGIPWMFLTVLLGVYLCVKYFKKKQQLRQDLVPPSPPTSKANPPPSSPSSSSSLKKEKISWTTKAIATTGGGSQEDMMDVTMMVPVSRNEKKGNDDDLIIGKDFDFVEEETNCTTDTSTQTLSSSVSKKVDLPAERCSFPTSSSSSQNSSFTFVSAAFPEGEISTEGTCSSISQLPLRVMKTCKEVKVKCPFNDVYDETDETLLAFLAFLEQRKAACRHEKDREE